MKKRKPTAYFVSPTSKRKKSLTTHTSTTSTFTSPQPNSTLGHSRVTPSPTEASSIRDTAHTPTISTGLRGNMYYQRNYH